jgi:hypothetical protein
MKNHYKKIIYFISPKTSVILVPTLLQCVPPLSPKKNGNIYKMKTEHMHVVFSTLFHFYLKNKIDTIFCHLIQNNKNALEVFFLLIS